MNDVIGSVRQTLQDFLAHELRQHRAELVSIRGELSAKIEAVESKIGAVETRLDSKINVVDSKIDVLKSEVRAGFTALGAQLENAVLRGELSTTREISDLRIRVERLERGHLPQQLRIPSYERQLNYYTPCFQHSGDARGTFSRRRWYLIGVAIIDLSRIDLAL